MIYKCSTPFGITADGTRTVYMWQSLRASAQRLSASRLTARRILIVGRNGDPSAQRLSASRLTARAGPAAPCERFGVSCAQRLSASRLTALITLTRIEANMVPCSTPFGITADGTRPKRSTRSFTSTCSTPFGITADGTSVAGELV